MNSPFGGATSFTLGLKPILPDSHSNVLQPLLHKLEPLYFLDFSFPKIPLDRPVYRRNLLNPCRTRENIRSKGYKFFAKLPAAGPETLQILQDIKKSNCTKFIQHFEFDP